MANHGMQGHFSPGSAPHSPAGPPGLMMAGPMPHPDYMHPAAMGAGGQYIPIPMQVQPSIITHVCICPLAHASCMRLWFPCPMQSQSYVRMLSPSVIHTHIRVRMPLWPTHLSAIFLPEASLLTANLGMTQSKTPHQLDRCKIVCVCFVS